MKITSDLIKYNKQEPYISYFVKNGKFKGKEIKMYGKIKECKGCKDDFFAFNNHIKNGNGKFCSIPCRGHYYSKEKSYRWKGGIRKNGKVGYIRIMIPNYPNKDRGYVYQHRIVIESFIKRKLKSTEIVHHINGNRSDNRIENLQLMPRSEHISLHHRKI